MSMEDSTKKKNSTSKRKTRADTVCDVCNKKFRSRYRLKLHVAVHTGEKSFVCSICKRGYQQKWNLVTHVARVHSKEKPFKCNECGKAFGYSSHFKRHVKSHFLEKIQAPDDVKRRILNPHKCKFCEKCFESNYRLGLHLRTHTGNRPYVCDKCGKSFTSKRICGVHFKKKHLEAASPEDTVNGSFADSKLATENKTIALALEPLPKKELIPCEVCGKNIGRTSLKKHLNIHYRSRIYSCRFCKKEFLENGQRTVHERKHTGEKPYLCDICGRGHAQYGNLLTHRERFHNLNGKSSRMWNQKDRVSKKEKAAPENSVQNLSTGAESLHSKTREKTQESTEVDFDNSNTFNDLPENSPSNSQKNPKYTGNETIEEFLKIASTWANKKFKESKEAKETNSDNDSLPEFELKDSGSEEEDEVNETEFPNEIINKSDSEKATSSKTKTSDNFLKEIRRKMNKIIYEKILESLQNTSIKNKVTQIAKKINETKKDGDVLREFFKIMKTVPDNSVMTRKEGKVMWNCWMCQSKLGSRHLLARHLLIHEPEENRPYKCEICHKTFTQSNNFKEHTMSHHNENQYYCEKCGSGFRHKSHFNMHMKRHGGTPIPKRYECTYCGKKVHTNHQKAEHERTHTRERPFLCKVCGQQFGASSTLNRHLTTHAVAKHQCAICLKFFRQKSSLKRHYATHSKYPYSRVSCECGKTFSQSPSLKKHKMICKNRAEPIVKAFACVICSKRFLTKSDLKRHVATHDSTKRFKCSVCLIYLKTGETLKRHLKRHEEAQHKPGPISLDALPTEAAKKEDPSQFK